MFEVKRFWQYKRKKIFQPTVSFNYNKLVIYDFFTLYYQYLYEPTTRKVKRVFIYSKPYRIHIIRGGRMRYETEYMRTYLGGWDSSTTCVNEYTIDMFTEKDRIDDHCTFSYPLAPFFDTIEQKMIWGSLGNTLIVTSFHNTPVNEPEIGDADFVQPVVYNDDTIMLIVGYENKTEIWKFTRDNFTEFYYSRSPKLSDYAEKIADLNIEITTSEGMNALWNKRKLLLYSGLKHVVYDVDKNDLQKLDTVLVNYVYSDYIYTLKNEIVDSNLKLISKLQLEEGERVTESSEKANVEFPFFTTRDEKRDYYNLITFKGFVPVLELKLLEHEFLNELYVRVIDLITKAVLNADIHMIRSRYCYDRTLLPLAIGSETVTVSDWYRVTARPGECTTIMIKDVHGVKTTIAERGHGITPMVSYAMF
ncbi:MAG: hypothetical protein QXJ97_04540 [Desulfurococcaceae archaeon]